MNSRPAQTQPTPPTPPPQREAVTEHVKDPKCPPRQCQTFTEDRFGEKGGGASCDLCHLPLPLPHNHFPLSGGLSAPTRPPDPALVFLCIGLLQELKRLCLLRPKNRQTWALQWNGPIKRVKRSLQRATRARNLSQSAPLAVPATALVADCMTTLFKRKTVTGSIDNAYEHTCCFTASLIDQQP